MEFNSHQKLARFTPSNAHQVLALVIQGHNSPYQRAWYPILLEYPSQDSQRDMVKRLDQVHKSLVDWLGELPFTLQELAEGAVPVFHVQDKNHTALSESEFQLTNTHCSPELLNKLYQERLRV